MYVVEIDVRRIVLVALLYLHISVDDATKKGNLDPAELFNNAFTCKYTLRCETIIRTIARKTINGGQESITVVEYSGDYCDSVSQAAALTGRDTPRC